MQKTLRMMRFCKTWDGNHNGERYMFKTELGTMAVIQMKNN